MAAIAVISALQPRESESRQKKDLGGMWNFRADYSPSRVQGFDQKWYAAPLSQVISLELLIYLSQHKGNLSAELSGRIFQLYTRAPFSQV